MPNIYLSQGDVVRLTTYHVARRYFSEPDSAAVLPARLQCLRVLDDSHRPADPNTPQAAH